MNLLATIQNEKAGKSVKKGGNEFLQIKLWSGNNIMADIYFHGGDGTIEIMGANGARKSFSPFDLGHK